MNGARLILMRTTIRELEQPFEPLAGPVYLLLVAQLVAGCVLVNALGFTVAPEVWWAAITWPIMPLGGMMMRRLGWRRSATAMECFGLTCGQAWASFLVLTPVAAISGPFADAMLAATDRALGFDFIAYAATMRPYLGLLAYSYKSYHWQPLLIIAFLSWTGRTARCWHFITAGAVALVITTVVFPLFPAEGPFVYYAVSEYGPLKAPWQFGPVLHALKDGERYLDYTLTTGLVSLPSYHAAAACIFVWATWPTFLRWLLIPLNVLLLLGTFVIGSHYLIDIIAGMAVAAIAITVVQIQAGRRAGVTAAHVLEPPTCPPPNVAGS